MRASDTRKRISKRALLLLTLAAFAVTAVTLAVAPEYAVEWWTVDGGGGRLSGDRYTLAGSAGQAEAGAVLSGGAYSVSGGFWGRAATRHTVYLPLVLQNAR